MTCRFGCRQPAVALVETTRGCIVYPEDITQWLCLQHLMKAISQGFLDDWRVIELAPGVKSIQGIEVKPRALRTVTVEGQDYDVVFDGRQETVPYESKASPLLAAAIGSGVYTDATAAERHRRMMRRKHLLHVIAARSK